MAPEVPPFSEVPINEAFSAWETDEGPRTVYCRLSVQLRAERVYQSKDDNENWLNNRTGPSRDSHLCPVHLMLRVHNRWRTEAWELGTKILYTPPILRLQGRRKIALER